MFNSHGEILISISTKMKPGFYRKNKAQIWRFLTKICNTDCDFHDICYATSNASFSVVIWSYKLKFQLLTDRILYFHFFILGGHSVLSIATRFEGPRRYPHRISYDGLVWFINLRVTMRFRSVLMIPVHVF